MNDIENPPGTQPPIQYQDPPTPTPQRTKRELTPEHKAKMQAGRVARADANRQAKETAAARAVELDAEARARMASGAQALATNSALLENPAGVAADVAPPASPTPAGPASDACRCGHGAQYHQLDQRRHPTELVCHFNINGAGQICACGHYVLMPPPPPLRPTTTTIAEGIAAVRERAVTRNRIDDERSAQLDTLDVLEALLLHTRLKATVGYVQGRCMACVETHRTGSHQACVRAWEWLSSERRRLGV